MKIKVQVLLNVSNFSSFEDAQAGKEEAHEALKHDFADYVKLGAKFHTIHFEEFDSNNPEHAQACFSALMEAESEVILKYIEVLRDGDAFDPDSVVE